MGEAQATIDAPAPDARPTPAPWTVPAPDAYRLLDSAARGLAAEQARERLARNGFNELPAPRRTPLALRFAAQFTDVFALLLLGAATLTFLAGLLSRPVDVGSVQLGVAILGVVVLNAGIGFVQEYSAERTVATLQAMVPARCRVLRDGQRQEVAVREVVRATDWLVLAGFGLALLIADEARKWLQRRRTNRSGRT